MELEDLKEHFDRILAERDRLNEERYNRVEDRFSSQDKALIIQALEYERRLEQLNGEYKRDQSRQAGYVSTEKYETTLEAEKMARETALLRVDEKIEDGFKLVNNQLQDYIKRYELEKREIDLRLAAQAGAADEAKRAAEEQGRKSDQLAKDQARKQSRNLGVASLVLGGIVFATNVLPSLF